MQVYLVVISGLGFPDHDRAGIRQQTCAVIEDISSAVFDAVHELRKADPIGILMEAECSATNVNETSRFCLGNKRKNLIEDDIWELGAIWYEWCFLFFHVGEERKRL